MSDDIKVGDVCEVFDACCATARTLMLGAECTVVPTTCCANLAMVCDVCRSKFPDHVTIVGDAFPGSERMPMHVPRKFLRKKRPPERDDAEPRTEFKPANEDDWDSTQWHPRKTRETEPA